jgi:hypothetical protein
VECRDGGIVLPRLRVAANDWEIAAIASPGGAGRGRDGQGATKLLGRRERGGPGLVAGLR